MYKDRKFCESEGDRLQELTTVMATIVIVWDLRGNNCFSQSWQGGLTAQAHVIHSWRSQNFHLLIHVHDIPLIPTFTSLSPYSRVAFAFSIPPPFLHPCTVFLSQQQLRHLSHWTCKIQTKSAKYLRKRSLFSGPSSRYNGTCWFLQGVSPLFPSVFRIIANINRLSI